MSFGTVLHVLQAVMLVKFEAKTNVLKTLVAMVGSLLAVTNSNLGMIDVDQPLRN